MFEQNAYDEYASEYANLVDSDADSLVRDLVIPELLRLVGDVADRRVLDAGCGEGRIARALHERGARVTAIDVSPRLIEIARKRDLGSAIDFRCFDLSTSPPSDCGKRFDVVVSNLVVDDVPDFVGFVRSICEMAKDHSLIVLSKNNPYSAVVRDKVENYFDTGTKAEYRGLAAAGVRVCYYHRTLEECIIEFCSHGYCLSHLSDLKPSQTLRQHPDCQARDRFNRCFRFPFLMVMAFERR